MVSDCQVGYGLGIGCGGFPDVRSAAARVL